MDELLVALTGAKWADKLAVNLELLMVVKWVARMVLTQAESWAAW